MSHQRYPSHDAIKEPHSISLKVLRLSRPSLVQQQTLAPPLSKSTTLEPSPASLAYQTKGSTNPSPFLLSPILNLPFAFGSAYTGETFSCTLCANNDLPTSSRAIRDVKIEAEMKTPSVGRAQKLELKTQHGESPRDLEPGETVQGVVGFDLKEEGNHVLAVTVSYYEVSETSGRTRTFRKLYQFICKSSLIVRTKMSPLPALPSGRRRWVVEAQLENCSEDVMQLETVRMSVEDGLRWKGCNWEAGGSKGPVVKPGEVEQVCFVVETIDEGGVMKALPDGRLVFGVLEISWRGEMGNRGSLSTGKLGTKVRT